MEMQGPDGRSAQGDLRKQRQRQSHGRQEGELVAGASLITLWCIWSPSAAHSLLVGMLKHQENMKFKNFSILCACVCV